MRRRYTASVTILLLALAGCSTGNSNQASSSAATPSEQPSPSAAAAPAPSGEEVEIDFRNPPADDLRAPDTYTVRMETTAGPISITSRVLGAKGGRFYTLVRSGYLTDIAMFRVISGFMAQGGLHGDPAVNRVWRNRRIQDDPVTQQNARGMVTFAMAGPNTRTTQFFINLVDNRRLDSMGFAPFGRITDMTAVDALHSGYGEGAPRGRGPDQSRIGSAGNTYLRADFPELDYIQSASIVE